MRVFSKLTMVCVCSLTLATVEVHAGLDVGAGSTIDFGDAVIDMGCSDLIVDGTTNTSASQVTGLDNVTIDASGTLNAGGAQITLAGNFSNSGTLSAGSGTVAIVDGCSRTQSSISGDSTFHDLSITSATGKQVVFESGKTTTVAGTLTLQGAAGNLLKVRSSTPGSPAMLSATPQQVIQFVDVADNRAVGSVIAPGSPSKYESKASGNLFRWFFYDVNGLLPFQPIPSLSAWSLFAVSALLSLLGIRGYRRARARVGRY